GAVPELGGRPAGELEGDPRLADAADPGEGDEADVVAPAELRERRELALPAEERRRRSRDSLGRPPARRCFERGVVREDRLLELPERLAGLDPQLVDERAARSLVDGERLGLPARAVQRQHELGAQTLAEGVPA